MKSFLINQGGMNDSLLVGPYATTALVPATPWLKAAAPPLPTARLSETATGTRLLLRTAGTAAPWQYAIRLRTDTAWITMVVAGATTSWAIPPGMSPTSLSVVSLNRVGTESLPVTVTFPTRTGQYGSSSTPARGRADAP
jgi:hypothetical protein